MHYVLLLPRPARRRTSAPVWWAIIECWLLVQTACISVEGSPGAAATSARAAATPVPTRAISTPAPGRTATPTPVRARTPTPELPSETDIEQSVANARATFERVLGSAALPGLEAILLDTVALAAPSGGEQLSRAAAARWHVADQWRADGATDFERHQHQALIIAATQGWAPIAPLSTSELGFMLRRYDGTGAQDPDNGDWLIDTLEAE